LLTAFDLEYDIDDDTESAIRERAYFLWLEDGQPLGQHEGHWHRARTEAEKASANGAVEEHAPTEGSKADARGRRLAD